MILRRLITRLTNQNRCFYGGFLDFRSSTRSSDPLQIPGFSVLSHLPIRILGSLFSHFGGDALDSSAF